MKVINTLLSFGGLSALLGAIFLNILGHKDGSFMLISFSAVSFLLMLILHFYKMYLIMNFRRNSSN